MLTRLDQLNAQIKADLKEPLRIGIGIHFGARTGLAPAEESPKNKKRSKGDDHYDRLSGAATVFVGRL